MIVLIWLSIKKSCKNFTDGRTQKIRGSGIKKFARINVDILWISDLFFVVTRSAGNVLFPRTPESLKNES